ncbi:hypothetical protein RDWZM_003244 [Blomia tropicalis]|uniref:Uncharacterized protein n=1 Tax=Blomia tropicalis TaxID=40697 RepID=A0A9Q0MF62_BLOTA|nr:hypothetical protein RDWZM_003244 [Blomia tropicalis]
MEKGVTTTPASSLFLSTSNRNLMNMNSNQSIDSSLSIDDESNSNNKEEFVNSRLQSSPPIFDLDNDDVISLLNDDEMKISRSAGQTPVATSSDDNVESSSAIVQSVTPPEQFNSAIEVVTDEDKKLSSSSDLSKNPTVQTMVNNNSILSRSSPRALAMLKAATSSTIQLDSLANYSGDNLSPRQMIRRRQLQTVIQESTSPSTSPKRSSSFVPMSRGSQALRATKVWPIFSSIKTEEENSEEVATPTLKVIGGGTSSPSGSILRSPANSGSKKITHVSFTNPLVTSELLYDLNSSSVGLDKIFDSNQYSVTNIKPSVVCTENLEVTDPTDNSPRCAIKKLRTNDNLAVVTSFEMRNIDSGIRSLRYNNSRTCLKVFNDAAEVVTELDKNVIIPENKQSIELDTESLAKTAINQSENEINIEESSEKAADNEPKIKVTTENVDHVPITIEQKLDTNKTTEVIKEQVTPVLKEKDVDKTTFNVSKLPTLETNEGCPVEKVSIHSSDNESSKIGKSLTIKQELSDDQEKNCKEVAEKKPGISIADVGRSLFLNTLSSSNKSISKVNSSLLSISQRSLSILMQATSRPPNVFVEKTNSNTSDNESEDCSLTNSKPILPLTSDLTSSTFTSPFRRGLACLQAAKEKQKYRTSPYSKQNISSTNITFGKSILRRPPSNQPKVATMSRMVGPRLPRVFFNDPIISSAIEFDISESKLIIVGKFSPKCDDDDEESDEAITYPKPIETKKPVDEKIITNGTGRFKVTGALFTKIVKPSNEMLINMRRKPKLHHQNSTFEDCDNFGNEQLSDVLQVENRQKTGEKIQTHSGKSSMEVNDGGNESHRKSLPPDTTFSIDYDITNKSLIHSNCEKIHNTLLSLSNEKEPEIEVVEVDSHNLIEEQIIEEIDDSIIEPGEIKKQMHNATYSKPHKTNSKKESNINEIIPPVEVITVDYVPTLTPTFNSSNSFLPLTQRKSAKKLNKQPANKSSMSKNGRSGSPLICLVNPDEQLSYQTIETCDSSVQTERISTCDGECRSKNDEEKNTNVAGDNDDGPLIDIKMPLKLARQFYRYLGTYLKKYDN